VNRFPHGPRRPYATLATIALMTAVGLSSTTMSLSSAGPRNMVPAPIKAAGVLTVASDIEYPPFESYTSNNKVVGIDYQIAQGLASAFGLKLSFINVPFDGIIPGLISQRYDMAISGMTDTVQRESQVRFVDYFFVANGILVAGKNPDNITSMSDLCGKAVAVQTGTTDPPLAAQQSKACQSEGKPALDVTSYEDQSTALLALKTGREVALLMGSAAGAYVARTSNDAFKLVGAFGHGCFAVVLAQKATALATAVQAGLRQMKQNGSYGNILAQFGEQTGALSNFQINGAATGQGACG
jgi:polar amino acid transport system substrate-binding protein